MNSVLFSKSECSSCMGLGKWSKDLGFENFDGILSLLDIEFVTRVPLRLPSSFPSQLVLLMVAREKEYMKLDVGKVVDHMTRESCVPTDSVKSGDYSILIHNIGTGAHIESDKTNRHTWLVRVMKYRADNI